MYRLKKDMNLSSGQLKSFAVLLGVLTGLIVCSCCFCRRNKSKVHTNSTPSYDKVLNVLN